MNIAENKVNLLSVVFDIIAPNISGRMELEQQGEHEQETTAPHNASISGESKSYQSETMNPSSKSKRQGCRCGGYSVLNKVKNFCGGQRCRCCAEFKPCSPGCKCINCKNPYGIRVVSSSHESMKKTTLPQGNTTQRTTVVCDGNLENVQFWLNLTKSHNLAQKSDILANKTMGSVEGTRCTKEKLEDSIQKVGVNRSTRACLSWPSTNIIVDTVFSSDEDMSSQEYTLISPLDIHSHKPGSPRSASQDATNGTDDDRGATDLHI